jgi:hypothetical protein
LPTFYEISDSGGARVFKMRGQINNKYYMTF